MAEVNTSDVGIGAVLSQRSTREGLLHPCAFLSKKLTSAERNYDVGERELLTIKTMDSGESVKPMSPLLQCCSDPTSENPDYILPHTCVLGAVQWEVEQRVLQAL